MRAVNLLPAQHRPRTAGGARSGSAYVVVGLLVVVLAAAFAYVHTLNSITEQTDETARLAAETEVLEAQAAKLGAFAQFRQVKQLREQSVRRVTQRRFDWERLVRELARVVPEDVWFTSFDGSANTSGVNAGGGEGGSTPAAAPAGPGAPGGAESGSGAAVALSGCAPTQRRVADTLLRLRRLHATREVKLTESRRTDNSADGAQGTGGEATDDCGETNGRKNFKFTATVVLAATAAGSQPGAGTRVPASLGGGQ